MLVPLKLPPLKDRTDVLADWVELRTLADSIGVFQFSKLKRYWDTQRNSEDTDVEGRRTEEDNTDEDGVSGYDEDKFLDAITDELGERAKVLSSSYPFQFSDDGLRFSVKEDVSIGGWTYLLCILFDHHKVGEMWNGKWTPHITNTERDLFQACSTLAAAGKVQGCAISFGWPRPNANPPFLQKLKEVYEKFGEGKPRQIAPPGASPMVKDEEIDIIAWQPRADGAAGTFYMLGQVASGENWTGKSILGGPIKFFHQTWFETIPASEPLAAIFIPHAVPPMGEGSRKDRIERLTVAFGMIFDRMLLPRMTQDGHSLAMNPDNNFYIERVDDSSKIQAWVDLQISSLRKLAFDLPL
jgi:hypothetical protein